LLSAWNRIKGDSKGAMLINTLVAITVIMVAITIMHRLVLASGERMVAGEAHIQANQAAQNIAEIKRIKPLEYIEYHEEWRSIEEYGALDTQMTDSENIEYMVLEGDLSGEIEIKTRRVNEAGEILATAAMHLERYEP